MSNNPPELVLAVREVERIAALHEMNNPAPTRIDNDELAAREQAVRGLLTRRSVSPKRLVAPGPDVQTLDLFHALCLLVVSPIVPRAPG